MTEPRHLGADDLVASQISDHVLALEQRITTANMPGNLDGLFAYHVLYGAQIPTLNWNVNCVTEHWLKENADRLDTAPVMAALGYGLTHFGSAAAAEVRPRLVAGLRDLMRRDPFPPDRVTFLNDPRQLLGVALAVVAIADLDPQVHAWLQGMLRDNRLQPTSRFQRLIHRHVDSTLSGEAFVLGDLVHTHDIAELTLAFWVASVGTARMADPVHDLGLVQRRVMAGVLCTPAAELSVPKAALLRAVVGQIINASVDEMVLNRHHISVVLHRFEAAMRRWRWDDDARVRKPVQWEVISEREVQDILWLILRSVFDDIVDEETLPKVGHSSYRADFGIPRLGVLVEVKYARAASDFKKIEKEIMEDASAYLRNTSTYQKIIVFVYDESGSVQEHDITGAALRGLPHVIDVIIVSRPSQLRPPLSSKRSGAKGSSQPTGA